MRILLASALERERRYLITGLSASGFNVSTACTSALVWQALMRHQIDLIVLDASVSSAQLDPWALIGDLAQLDDPRLIVLTRSDPAKDRLRAFRCGVCYYLTMPVSVAELAALLRGVARQDQKWPNVKRRGPDYADPTMQIDFANREIRRKRKTFQLSGREHSLLQLLLANAGNVSSSEKLCRSIWGKNSWPAKRVQLKMEILNLRRKIERDYRHPRYLISHRGLGYAFMFPEQQN